MRKIMLTVCPLLTGFLLVHAMGLSKEGFYIQNMLTSIPVIFIVNSLICGIILFTSDVIATVVYVYNLFWMGGVIYIMLFVMNQKIYFHAPVELCTFIYTYIYARKKEKPQQMIIILVILLVSAIIEGVVSYV